MRPFGLSGSRPLTDDDSAAAARYRFLGTAAEARSDDRREDGGGDEATMLGRGRARRHRGWTATALGGAAWAHALGRSPAWCGRRAGNGAAARELGLEALTPYAFDAELAAPGGRVQVLMELLAEFVRREWDEILGQGIRLTTIGELGRLPPGARGCSCRRSSPSRREPRHDAVPAPAWRASRSSPRRARWPSVRRGELEVDAIDEAARRGAGDGPSRRSICWCAPWASSGSRTSSSGRPHAELYFTEVLWPDFDRAELERALAAFAARQRRFGRVEPALAEALSGFTRAGRSMARSVQVGPSPTDGASTKALSVVIAGGSPGSQASSASQPRGSSKGAVVDETDPNWKGPAAGRLRPRSTRRPSRGPAATRGSASTARSRPRRWHRLPLLRVLGIGNAEGRRLEVTGDVDEQYARVGASFELEEGDDGWSLGDRIEE
ncbi:MAG: hypothetical protein U1F43_34295 [Myxococcota bacterium]